MKNIISISGDIGGGKSSVAKSLCELTGYGVVSTGVIQRKIAEKKSITTLELNTISQTDRSVDDEIDSYVIELGKKNDLIVDSRLAWHFIPDSFKVYLSVDPIMGGERVYNAFRSSENNPSIEATVENNLSRQRMESNRFSILYDINFRDFANYDLVIDTSYASPESVAMKILECFRKWGLGSPFHKVWVSPQILIPTHDLRLVDMKKYEEILESIKDGGFLESGSLDVFICRGFMYIWDGHKRVMAAAKAGVDLLPAALLTSDPDFELIKGLSVATVSHDVPKSLFYDWEDALGFKYKRYPETIKSVH